MLYNLKIYKVVTSSYIFLEMGTIRSGIEKEQLWNFSFYSRLSKDRPARSFSAWISR